MIGFLLYKRDQVKSLLKPVLAVFILLLISFFSFWVQFYVLEHLPIVDCLPYKKGIDIKEKMQIPAGAIPDSTVINFVYQKDGKEVEFDAEHMLLAVISEVKSNEEWIYQYKNCPTFFARREAIKNLSGQ
jgi:hypothetical protein